MAQKVQVFRRKQEQKPQQEPSKAKLPSWEEAQQWARQELARLQQEDPAAYEREMEALRSDVTPPCVDPSPEA